MNFNSKRRLKKFLSVTTALGIILSFSACKSDHTSQKEAQKDTQKTYDSSALSSGDLIIFGKEDDALSFDGQWRVLDPQKTNTGKDGMYLTSEHLVAPDTETGILFNDVENPTDNDYQDTTIWHFCSDFLQNHFTEDEQAVIIKTYKSDPEYHTPTKLGDRDVLVDFDPAENILNGDQIFLLSAEEVNNEAYGFSDNTSRIATFKGEAANWWLRSPHDDDYPLDVGFVFVNGWQADLYVNGFSMLHTPYTARLAMNIDTSKVVFTKMSETDGHTIWQMHLK